MRKLPLLIVLSAGIILSAPAYAEDLTLPYPDFRPGSPAYANSVDANFEAVTSGVNRNNAAIVINSGNIKANSSSIETVKEVLSDHGHSPADIVPQGSGSTLDADLLDGADSTAFAESVHGHVPAELAPQGAGSGLDADLLDGANSADFADSVHGHLPSDITSQGSGSGLDADLLDGADSTAFAESVHGHVPSDLTSQGSGSGLDADMLDGVDSEDLARAVHDHDPRYTLTGHTHPSGEITGEINADTLGNLQASDFAGKIHDHPEYAPASHKHDKDYAPLKHGHEDYKEAILSQEKRLSLLESYGDLSGALDEIRDLQKTIKELRSKIADLESELKRASQ